MKNITIFHLKTMIFTAVKYCSILHRHVIVLKMTYHVLRLFPVEMFEFSRFLYSLETPH